MPIFEFQCNKCLSVFEEFILDNKDLRGIKCINCGASSIKRLFSGAHFSKFRKCERAEDCDYCPRKYFGACT